MHFNCSFHYHSFLNGNAFQLFQVCHFYLINHNMIFRLKYGSCIQLFLIPQSYTWRGNLCVETPVLQSEMCWFVLTLNNFLLFLLFSQYMFLFRYKFYISDNIWHRLSLFLKSDMNLEDANSQYFFNSFAVNIDRFILS